MQIASWLFALPLAVISLYMLAIVVGSWLLRSHDAAGSRLPAFVVIIPAHNEEAGVGATIARLRAAAYPKHLLRLLVIADNCSDRTAEVARAAGAEALERHDLHNRGKGQALDWVLRQHRELFEGRELIAFVDADMQVDGHFFARMAETFDSVGINVAQGRYVISNPARSVLSAMGYVSFCYVNHVRPAGRCYWGGTADLKGGGMVFRTQFLLPRGWSAHSIAEDIQLGKELMLEGVRVHYVPAAIVESDIPSTLAQVKVQQSRWERGKREVHASVLPRARKLLLRRPSMLLLDGVFDLLVPPLSLIVLWGLLAAALSWWAGSSSLWVVLASLTVFALAVLSGLAQNRASPGVYLRLAAAPAFLLWKIALLLRVALAKAPATWQRTPRDPR